MTPAAAPPPTSSSTGNDSDSQLFSQNVKDVFFDYDSYEISSQAEAVIQSDARFLQQHPNMSFLIEGHCDERGSIEYNLALGENRAQAAKQALVQAGVSATRMRTISYGKEKTVLHRKHGSLLAAEPPRPLRVLEVTRSCR